MPYKSTKRWFVGDGVSVPIQTDEKLRLAALHRLGILDTPAEKEFDRIVRLAAHIAGTPMAALSLVDRDRVWFKARIGMEALEAPRCVSFCHHAIRQRDPFIVSDASADPLFLDNPLVCGEPYLRFYCAIPLFDDRGNALGALSVIDTKPHDGVPGETLGALCELTDAIYDSLVKPRHQIAVKNAELSVLHAAIEAAGDGVALTDADGVFIYMNNAHAQMFGYDDRSALIGQSWRVLYDPAQQTKVEEEAMAALGAKGDWRGELTGRMADGSPIMQEVNLTALPYGGLICSTRDISRRKRMEQDNRRLESELMERHKMEALGTLAGGLAHEINTPTQYIGDNIDFLKEGFDTLSDFLARFRALATEHAPHAAAAVEKEADAAELDYLVEESTLAIAQCGTGIRRIRDLVNAIKRFSHPGDDDLAPNDLKPAIDLAVSLTVNQWKYVAELEVDIPDDLPQLPCNPGDITQVVLNLIVNAAHAIEEARPEGRGHIGISVQLRGNDLALIVRDTGTGIAPEIADRIFEPFFTTKEPGRGTGQGLALCHRIVTERHHGRIAMRSTPGAGSEFEILLPLHQVQEVETERAA